MMTLRNTDVSTVESDMKEEVQYLYTANSDDTIPAMDTPVSYTHLDVYKRQAL